MYILCAQKVFLYRKVFVNPAVASTMAFATLTLARLFHGFNCRSHFSLFRIGLGSNPWSIAAFIMGTLLLALVLFVPSMQGLFMVSELTGAQIAWMAVLACVPTIAVQSMRVLREHL